MKLIKYSISFICLVLIGAMISYADSKVLNEYSSLISTFEKTEADFKFYNIKANAVINKDISKDDINDICIELINNLGLEESSVVWDKKWDEANNQIYATIKNENLTISVAGIKKGEQESYIIVDILENKVYKNIVDIYGIIEDTMGKYSSELDLYTCIAGEYSKKLQMSKYDDILKEILYNMNATEIDRVTEENFLSVSAYSKIIKDNYLEYLGSKMNLNIGMRYSEDEEKTLLYIATPIIKLDY